MKYIIILICFFYNIPILSQNNIQIGAYYFDGWAGKRNTNEEWARNAPTHLSYKLMTKFPERKPIWGWRDDDIRIMEKQIELASNNGLDFFVFCWYFSPDKGDFNAEKTEHLPQNTALSLFLKANNKHKMKFSIIVCNHKGFEIEKEENWIRTINYLSDTFFNDSQYLKIENKPVISFFNSKESIPFITKIKNETKRHGFSDLFVISNHNMNNVFDAHGWYNIREKEPGYQEKRKYTILTQHTENIWNKYKNNFNVIPLVMSGWDQRPWEAQKEKTLYYTDKSPKAFMNHLQNAISFVKNNEKCKIKMVLIYAWNEYGEGGWLAPTKGDKVGRYLKIIKQVKKNNICKYENSIH